MDKIKPILKVCRKFQSCLFPAVVSGREFNLIHSGQNNFSEPPDVGI